MKKSDEQERNIANRLYNLDKKVYETTGSTLGRVFRRYQAPLHRYKDLPFVTGKGAYILSLIENIFLKTR